MSSIEDRAKFDFIRYANCWEDPELVLEALHPLEHETVLSIASAGDNSFSLLCGNPKKVIAVDFNPAQIACVDLRKTAILKLNYENTLAFLGITPAQNREEIYHNTLRAELREESKQYWDQHIEGIKNGIIHYGKFERYLKWFGTKLLPFIQGEKKISTLLEKKSVEEQEQFYSNHWDTVLWKVLFKVFFSKTIMGRAGRDAEFFAYMETSPAEAILKRTKHALTAIPTFSNPYLRYILTGNFNGGLPHYLKKENYTIIRKNLGKLELLQMGVLQAMDLYPQEITRFNLSDIFEYMSVEEFAKISEALFKKSGDHAKVAYWNLLAYRNLGSHTNYWVTDEINSERLHLSDKAWFYSQFFVTEKKYA